MKIAIYLFAFAIVATASGNRAALAETATTPTVAEVKAAFSGITHKFTSSRSGNPITMKYLPSGKLQLEIEARNDVYYRT